MKRNAYRTETYLRYKREQFGFFFCLGLSLCIDGEGLVGVKKSKLSYGLISGA